MTRASLMRTVESGQQPAFAGCLFLAIRPDRQRRQTRDHVGMTQSLIALGGNLGISESVFESAMLRLQRPGIQLVRLSRAVETRPVGTSAGPSFLNAAAILNCELSPEELLKALHAVEQDFGRTRTVHWGPRSLDLDLCLWGQTMIDRSDLVVPHPALWYRRFVLDPAAEIAPDMLHPVLGQSIGQLQSRLAVRPLVLAVRRPKSTESEIFPDIPDLVRLTDAVDWRWTDDDLCDTPEVFAEVIMETRPDMPTDRTQPRHEASRVLRVFANSRGEMLTQVQTLLAAILG